MNTNIYAFTELGTYPGYVSINREENGDVSITVRSQPNARIGSRICRQKKDAGPGDCYPGSEHCNNYCNMHPDKSLPMPDHPLKCEQVFEGESATFTMTAADWENLVKELSK